MARGSKRAPTESGEEDEGEHGSYSSQSPHATKRRALSNAASRTNGDARQSRQFDSTKEKTIEAESDEEDKESGGEGVSSAHEEDAEEQGSADEQDKMDEMDEDAEGDATIGEAYLREAENEAAQTMGVIEKVVVKNFMCHNHMEVALGPKLNFIIGHNGSGKSAVLTAITIALGAKASSTSRGSSLKSFVKEGKDKATVQLTLKNTGSEAYEWEKYGDKIIIERTIRSDGIGTWKIKNVEDRVVSTTRDELNCICDHANIQIDNPINVLTQDAARQFLSTSNPNDKYDFFLRGTQLSQLETEYDAIKRNIEDIDTILSQKKGGLKDLAAKAKETAQRYNIFQRIERDKGEYHKVAAQFMWAHVARDENELENEAFQLQRKKLQVEKLEGQITEAEEELRKMDDLIRECEQRTKDEDARAQPIIDELDRNRQQLAEKKAELSAFREEEQKQNAQYERVKASLADVNERIEQTEKSMSDHGHSRRQILSKQREQAHSESKAFEDAKREYEHQVRTLNGDISDSERRKSELQGRREQLRNNIEELHSQKQKLLSAKSNRLAAYGPNMPKLLELVRNEQRWIGPVVGPIGAKVKVKDARWTPVLESVIGNTLNAFCVTNHQDRRLLLDLKRRAQCDEIPVLTGSDELFDYADGEPDASILTILRILDIQDEFVKRQLINSVSIERAALVERRAEGDVLLRNRPRNVKLAFSLDLFRVQYGEAGGSTQTLQPYRGPPRLSSDVDAHLNEATKRLEELETDLRNVEEDLAMLGRKLKQDQDDQRVAMQNIRTAQTKKKEMEYEYQRLDEELRADEPSNMTALQETKREFETELEKQRENYVKLTEQKRECEQSLDPVLQRRRDLRGQLEEMKSENQTSSEKLAGYAEARLKVVTHKHHRERQLEENKAKVLDQERRVRRLADKVTKITEQTKERYDRVEVERSPEAYEKEVNAIQARITEFEKQHQVDSEALLRETNQAQAAFQRATGEMENLSAARELLNESLLLRLEKWRLFRKLIAMRAKNLFTHFLSFRGYGGTLMFDHQKRQLALRVKTDTGAGARADKDPLSLSGGEKSYSTICLLLALWEAIGCPIRCLDEFDVFMDAVNRRMSMRLVMNVAKRIASTQYILITPQNISNISIGPDVRVHRLADPERNQTVIA